MAITKKQCAWPECDEEFYGTERKEYCGNTCKNKQWRLDKKESDKCITKNGKSAVSFTIKIRQKVSG